MQSLGSDKFSRTEEIALKDIALKQEILEAQLAVATHMWKLIPALSYNQILTPAFYL